MSKNNEQDSTPSVPKTDEERNAAFGLLDQLLKELGREEALRRELATSLLQHGPAQNDRTGWTRFHYEAQWLMPIAEAEYEEQYWEYYGEKFGWKEIVERVVEGPLSQLEYDENGKPERIYYGGSAYLRSTWRPREKREESRSSTSEWPEGRGTHGIDC